MRILVYGGRNYGVLTDDAGRWVGYSAGAACAILTGLTKVIGATHRDTLISGGATGADALGELVGEALGMDVEVYEAEWDRYGRSAGPRRNKEMRDSGIDYAVKCPGGRGTAHMTKLLEESEVPIYEV